MTSPATACVSDPTKLEELAAIGGGREFAAEVVACFLADGARRTTAATTAALARDLDAWTRETHTLKSAAAAVGAEALRELCLRFETAARAGEIPAPEAARELAAEFARAEAALRAWAGA